MTEDSGFDIWFLTALDPTVLLYQTQYDDPTLYRFDCATFILAACAVFYYHAIPLVRHTAAPQGVEDEESDHVIHPWIMIGGRIP